MDREIINQLDIPTGLKDLLISRGFTIEQLINMESNDIAKALKKVLNNAQLYTRENCLNAVKPYTPLRVLTPLYKKIKEINEVVTKRS